ncbi:tissue factor-like isoform X2 [Syngnathus typhle]|uniref:tissue factor-like isoform X2 n=1 Tax=Syngnathus typhle TaxID=161592 RepID=UPI002A6ACCA0|nr:tissue factor-like isoform X2 [Syngnathus typhle]
MLRTKGTTALLMLLILVFLHSNAVIGFYPSAQNVTWKSTNFKTILTWEPLPTDYSYTVEFSVVAKDKQRNSNCIRISTTMCDLTSSLTDLNACYVADVLSEPPLGVTSDLTEFPYTSSSRFCPANDTDIGRPDFKLDVSDDKKKTTLYVTDPLTALFKDDHQLNIRDIFLKKLHYKVTYRKNKSSGKKVFISQTNVIEMTNLDQGESYCFNVQAFIPSRSNKQLGKLSQTQCSDDDKQSIFEGDSPVKLLKYADDTTLIGLIQDGDETAYRQEVERLVHWCSQNHLELNPLKTVEMTVDFRHLQVPGNHNLSGPEMDRPHRLCPEEGPAEAVLPETAQEVQPAARASEDHLHCHHPVCPLHFHHCLVWIGLQTRQAQTVTDNQDCRKDHWNQPPIYPRLVPVQDQETCKEHLYRPFSPRLQSV